MSVSITYGDVALGAKENAEYTSAQKADFANLTDLKIENPVYTEYANPCELYNTVLDGTATPFPSQPDYIGLWSEDITDENGDFETPIVLTATMSNRYQSSGISIICDKHNDIYPTDVNLQWYLDNELIDDKDFTPDMSEYFCQNNPGIYNKVVITFNSLNMPYARLKLYDIQFGRGVTFSGAELKNIKVSQKIDPISTQIEIGTCDFTVVSKLNQEYSFSADQAIKVWWNEQLISTSFIKSATRKSRRIWEVKSEDYIAHMNDVLFEFDVYEDKNAVELLTEIFNEANVPFEIDEALEEETVSGYLKRMKCREALMQVCFAINAVVDTANSDKVKVRKLNTEITQTIPLTRIAVGQNFTTSAPVTAVRITQHTYTRDSSSPPAPHGEYDFVFSHDDVRYKHVATEITRYNDNLPTNTPENIKTIANATLVNANNLDSVMDKCYNYFVKNVQTKMKIIDGKHVQGGDYITYGQAKYGTVKYGGKTPVIISYDEPTHIGDVIGYDTEYMSEMSGIITQQTFNLNGGILVKESEVI